MKILGNVDIQRLAGIKSIIGIDLTEQRARVVELEKRGRLFDRFRATFRPLQSFTCEFSSATPAIEKAGLLKRMLAEHHVGTTVAVSTVQSIGVKTVTATIPPGTTNIDEWIQEHREKLLKLPISAGQIIHAYEILDQAESGTLIELTFARPADIEAAASLFHAAGLTLLSLAAGPRDAYSAFLLGEEGLVTKASRCVHIGDSMLSVVTCAEGKRTSSTYSRLAQGQDPASLVKESLQTFPEMEASTLIGGEVANEASYGLRVLKPFGLPTAYTLAAGLALKGFFPELSPANFLDQKGREQSEALTYRSLVQRVVLACGLTLIVLLLLQIVASFYLQSRIDTIDEKLLALGPAYTDVVMLENQVKALENQLEGRDVSFKRSRMAQTLHKIAGIAPDGLWLYRLHQDHPNGQPKVLALHGYARSNELVADFVKSLTSGVAEAMLIRAGTPLRSESLVPGGQESSQFITFQINLKMPH